MTKFYLTTTLPYVNAAPHIGHALEFFQADAIIRFYRKQLGVENVFFNVGTDEHGLKIYEKALAENQTPKEYADFYAAKWQEFCKLFNINYDNFYRTTDPAHYKAAQAFWKACDAKGDIYKKKYEGLYCVGCEEFKTEKDLVDGKCPLHNTVPIQYSEENYFFKLSKYKEELLDIYAKNKDKLKPSSKYDELINFIKNIEDISISRLKKNLPWGIPVPGDDAQVMYVWFDALTNYANAVGYSTDEEKFKQWWPVTQIFGPDNLRFQCAIWQGMLLSAGLEPSKKFLCHGTILGPDGRKMSKTIGNVVSPFDQLEKFGYEAVRFYMLSELPTYGDAAYLEPDLKASFNSKLADNFGNLLNRVIHLANKKEASINNADLVEPEFKKEVENRKSKIENLYTDFDIKLACDEIFQLAEYGNKYIQDNAPWSEKDSDKVQKVLNNLSYLISTVIDLYEPIIPTSCENARNALKNNETIILFKKFE
ncbi:MAG: methionine--tRNA ligase [Candidatus Dojkabacteria bacterium]